MKNFKLILFILAYLASSSLYAQWSFLELSEAKKDISGVQIGSEILLVGGAIGTSGPATNIVETFDCSTNALTPSEYSWYNAANMQSVTTGDYTLFANGTYTNVSNMFVYNSKDKTWEDLTNPYHRFGYCLVALNNKAYFAGGSGGLKQVDIYDFTAKTWTSEDLLSEGRSDIQSVVFGQKIFFIGGVQNIGLNQISKRVDVFNAVTNTWSNFDLPVVSYRAGIALVGNKIVHAGGQPSNNLTPSSLSKKVHLIDAIFQSVVSIGEMPEGNSEMQHVVVNGQVVFAGGSRNNAIVVKPSSNSITNYSLSLNSNNAYFLKGAKLGNKAYFAGAKDNDAKSVFIYDAVSQEWDTYELPEPQISPTMVSCGNTLVIAGGQTNSAPYLTKQVSILTDLSFVGNKNVEIEKNVVLSPNPATDNLTITLPEDLIGLESRVKVINVQGVEVINMALVSNQLDVSKIPIGIYAIVIQRGASVLNSRFVKN